MYNDFFLDNNFVRMNINRSMKWVEDTIGIATDTWREGRKDLQQLTVMLLDKSPQATFWNENAILEIVKIGSMFYNVGFMKGRSYTEDIHSIFGNIKVPIKYRMTVVSDMNVVSDDSGTFFAKFI